MGRKLLTSPDIAVKYTFLMNTWNTLLESYQQRVYNNTLATAKHQMQHAENPTPAVVLRVEAARVDNAILLDYLAADVALEEPETRSTDLNIRMDNSYRDDELHFGMPGGSGNYEEEGDERDLRDGIPPQSQRRCPATELERFDHGSSDFHGYEAVDGNDVDADKEEEPSPADDGSTQIVEY